MKKITRILYKFTDGVLFLLHALLAIFCISGWLLPGAEQWHLITIILIGLSWYGLGLWYGFGYCVLTDWQWRIRRRLGVSVAHGSFVKLLLEKAAGLHLAEQQVRWFAYLAYWLSAFISMVVNYRLWVANG